METGLFEIQADHLTETRRGSQLAPASREVVYALSRRADALDVDCDTAAEGMTSASEPMLSTDLAACLGYARDVLKSEKVYPSGA
jgi:hypothetical protein